MPSVSQRASWSALLQLVNCKLHCKLKSYESSHRFTENANFTFILTKRGGVSTWTYAIEKGVSQRQTAITCSKRKPDLYCCQSAYRYMAGCIALLLLYLLFTVVISEIPLQLWIFMGLHPFWERYRLWQGMPPAHWVRFSNLLLSVSPILSVLGEETSVKKVRGEDLSIIRSKS